VRYLRSRGSRDNLDTNPFTVAVGGLVPIAVGAALVPLRTVLDNTNLALLLVLTVVLAAGTAGRGAQIVAERPAGHRGQLVTIGSFDPARD
jgi:hypothetical protein